MPKPDNIVKVVITSIFFNILTSIAIVITVFTAPFRHLLSLRQPSPAPARVTIYSHPPSSSSSFTAAAPRDTILLIHGFPDAPQLWHATIHALTEAGYRCLVTATPTALGETISRALSTHEVVDMLHDALLQETKESVTIIGHDWGAFFAMQIQARFPESCKRIVLLDVGSMNFDSEMHWSTIYFMLSYQSLFALAYILGRPLGSRLLQALFTRFNYKGRDVAELTSDMAFPYMEAVSIIANVAMGKSKAPSRIVGEEANNHPTLFVYGQRKLINFHDNSWLQFVKNTPCGKVLPLPCSHWIMVDQPDLLNKNIVQWLDKSEPSVGQAA